MTRLRLGLGLGCTLALALVLLGVAEAQDPSVDEIGKYVKKGPLPPPRAVDQVQLTFPPPTSKKRPTLHTGPRAEELAVTLHQPEGVEQTPSQISVTFNQPMVAVSSVADLPASPVRVEPSIPGAWRWMGAESIALTPKTRVAGATHFTVTVPAGTRSTAGKTLAKAHVFHFDTQLPSVTQSQPADTSAEVALEAPVVLWFNQAVSADKIAPFVVLTNPAGTKIPLTPVPRAKWADDTRLRSLSGYSSSTFIAAFVPTAPLQRNTTYELHVRAGLVSDEGPLPMASAYRARFTTYPPMAVRNLQCGCNAWRNENAKECKVGENLCVTFNHTVKVARPEDFVTVTPRPADLKLRVASTGVSLEGTFRAGTRYDVRVAPGVKDEHGQPLATAWTASVPFVHLESSVETLVDAHVLIEAKGQLAVPFRLVNADSLSVEAYLLPDDQIARGLLLSQRSMGDSSFKSELEPLRRYRVAQWQLQPRLGADVSAVYALSLKKLVADHGPGPYLLVVDRAAHAILAQTTDIGLTVRSDSTHMVVLATSIATGKSLAGVKLRIIEHEGKPAISATTGSDGVATLTATSRQAEDRSSELLVHASLGNDRSFVPVNSYGDDNRSSSLNWGHARLPAQERTFFYPDRDLYRPGETVHIYGIHRRYAGAVDDSISVPPSQSVTWTARSSRDRELDKGTVTTSPFGTFAFAVKLPAEIDLGSVQIQTSLGSVGVQVQEYRAPEFDVSVKLARSQPLIRGASLDASVTGRYLFGAPMRQADLHWSVFSDDARFTPADSADFHFGSAINRWREHWRHYREGMNLIQSGSGKLDADGRAALSIPLVLGSGQLDPTHLTLEAQVTDLSRQIVAGRVTTLAHPADRYVGVRLPPSVIEAKRAAPIDLVLVDLDGKRVPVVTIEVKATQDTSVQSADTDDDGNAITTSKPKVITVTPCTVSSALTPQSCSLTFPIGGVYLLEVSAVDSKQHLVRTRTYVDVVGKDTQAKDTKAKRIELGFDKKQYQPGETAKVTLRVPFSEGVALLTEERRGLLGHQIVKIANYSGTAKVLARSQHVPNLELSATAIQARGKAHGPAAWATGSASMAIARDEKALTVSVRPAKTHARPGEQVAVEVTVTSGKRPVAARVSLVGVDEAVLGMSGFAIPSPLEFFHYLREPGVTLAELLKRLLPEEAPASRESNKDDSERKSKRMAKAEESMASGGPAPVVAAGGATAARRLFLTTPLADVLTTNAAGKATFILPLPDNLTRFRLMAVAVDAADRMGNGQSEVTVNRPLQLRASLPRFINTADAFTAVVLVDNQTGQAGQAEVTISADGVELLGPARSESSVGSGEAREVGFQVRAPKPGVAKIRFSVRLGHETDAVEVLVPIWTPATMEAFATYGTTTSQASQPLGLPKDVLPGFGGLSITLASTALTGLGDAVHYLTDYPYGCAEQVSSRAMPLFVLGDIVSQFGLGGPEVLALQKKNAQIAIDKLVSGQRSDGAWGTWANPSDEGRADLTAYILLVLRRGKDAGFVVPDDTVRRGSGYLTGWINHELADKPSRDRNANRRWAYDISAMALYALGDWGEKHEALARQIYPHARELDTFAKAMLAAVFHRLSPSSPERAALLRELQNRVIQTPSSIHFQEEQSEALQLLMHSSARTDAIVLLTLLEIDPRSELISKSVRGLMDARINGRWDTTQANAYALYALARYFQTNEAEPTQFSTGMWLGKSYLGESKFAGRSMREELLEVPMNVVKAIGPGEVTLAKTGSGRLYYRIGLRYAPREVRLAAADEGITVIRSYHALDKPDDVVRDKDGWQVKAGVYVRIDLEISVQDRRHYVVVDDPLPAGLELVNTEYKTSAHQAQNDEAGPFGSYPSWHFNHRELRDERSLHFADELPPGTYTLSVIARSTTRGTFITPPARSEEMYHPEVFGRSATDRMTVR